MLLKIGQFEAKTVLGNQALANEHLSFRCDFSLSLFAVHNAGSGEGASAMWCKCFTRVQIPALSTKASQ